jgi:hypothetical protein
MVTEGVEFERGQFARGRIQTDGENVEFVYRFFERPTAALGLNHGAKPDLAIARSQVLG